MLENRSGTGCRGWPLAVLQGRIRMQEFIFILYTWAASVVAGAIAGYAKRAAYPGACLGLFLGPVGVIAALGLDYRRECPICTGKADMHRDGKAICQYCRTPVYWRALTGEPLPDHAEQRKKPNGTTENS
jgi:hypothetical protein